jgi:hypothetical protein
MVIARVVALSLALMAGCGARTGLSVGETESDGGADAGADVFQDTGFDTGADVAQDTGQDAGETTCAYRAIGMPGISQVTCQVACVPGDGCVDIVPADDLPTFTCVTIECGASCSCTPTLAVCDCTGG